MSDSQTCDRSARKGKCRCVPKSIEQLGGPLQSRTGYAAYGFDCDGLNALDRSASLRSLFCCCHHDDGLIAMSKGIQQASREAI
jgi:hypothetical protein